jgi:hypothetical protein
MKAGDFLSRLFFVLFTKLTYIGRLGKRAEDRNPLR